MVTLKDVAEKAGVSTQLVSVVINGKAEQYRISPATSERIAEMAQQMGYDPENHRSARQMVARRNGHPIPSDTIAVCTVDHTISRAKPAEHPPSVYDHPYNGDILHGIEAAASEVGLDVLICRHCAEKLPRLIERQEVDGVIVSSAGDGVMAQIRELNLPAVKLINEHAPFHNISVADYQGIYDAVQYLAGLGHRNIAYIGHPVTPESDETRQASRRRFAGFQAAMQDCGLESEYADTSFGAQNLEVAAAAMEGLWKKSRGKITAVVCYNDVLAMGAIRALQKQGVRVPDEVSVTGFDDISRQFEFTPSITSVFYDRFKLGQRAVEILWNSRPQWLAGKKTKLVHEELSVKLAVRESTAPPRTKKENR